MIQGINARIDSSLGGIPILLSQAEITTTKETSNSEYATVSTGLYPASPVVESIEWGSMK